MNPYIYQPNDIADLRAVGGKARGLYELVALRIPVPAWFVVRPDALQSALDARQRQALTEADAAQAGAILSQLALPPVFAEALVAAARSLGGANELFAVRSSACNEDGGAHSFAGQLESYLFVSPADVPARVLDVWRSGFGERTFQYCKEHGLARPSSAPAVIVQRMVEADAAGVAFSADPVSGRRSLAIVSAVPGIASALVSGEVEADTFHVQRDGAIVERRIARKVSAQRRAPHGGTITEELSRERQQQQCISDRHVQEIAALARRVAAARGTPQDIEWAVAGEVVYLLQARPITALETRADPDSERMIWDNANIAESYGGMTTPLTFSFVQRVYEEVYRQFCLVLGVRRSVVEANYHTFRRMVGFVRGRVYYNLLSWYRVLALLPGFALNRAFMEQMMGVKEGLPDDLVRELSKASLGARFWDLFALLRAGAGLVLHLVLLPRTIQRFMRRFHTALQSETVDLTQLRADELVRHYWRLEQQLLTRWDAPLINDFFAMIFYGLLRSLSRTWCCDAGGSIQNDLVAGEEVVVSAEPARLIRELGSLIEPNATLSELMRVGSRADIERELQHHPDIQAAVDAYLTRFSDRCLDELKLETETLADDPLMLYRAAGQFAGGMQTGTVRRPNQRPADRATRAEEQALQALRANPLKRALFRLVLRHARARVRDRENLRFERTRLFGRVRRVFVELGKRFAAGGILELPRDIFYLDIREALGLVDGTTVSWDIRGLVQMRKAEFAGYASTPPPPDRFETRGVVPLSALVEGQVRTGLVGDHQTLQGIGCSHGLVRGRVRVVTDPRNAVLRAGEILVAPRTDPGWIMLFPLAAGLLVEHGSLLSHSAIVSREMGLPAIVSIPQVMSQLRDGMEVEMDGASGIVRILSERAA